MVYIAQGITDYRYAVEQDVRVRILGDGSSKV